MLTTLSRANAQVLPPRIDMRCVGRQGTHGPRSHGLPQAGVDAQRHGFAPDTAVRVQSRGRRGMAREAVVRLTPAGDPLAAGPTTRRLRTRARSGATPRMSGLHERPLSNGATALDETRLQRAYTVKLRNRGLGQMRASGSGFCLSAMRRSRLTRRQPQGRERGVNADYTFWGRRPSPSLRIDVRSVERARTSRSADPLAPPGRRGGSKTWMRA